MAIFFPQEIDLSKINGGVRYENGNIVDAEAINVPIEASYWAQKVSNEAHAKADQALQYAIGSVTGVLAPLSAWPINSVIMMDGVDTSPAVYLGGTWERTLVDRVPMGAGGKYSVGYNGGSETHKHTSTNGTLFAAWSYSTANGGIFYQERALTSYESEMFKNSNLRDDKLVLANAYQKADYSTQNGTNVYGETDEASSMMPFRAVSFWRRVE